MDISLEAWLDGFQTKYRGRVPQPQPRLHTDAARFDWTVLGRVRTDDPGALVVAGVSSSIDSSLGAAVDREDRA